MHRTFLRVVTILLPFLLAHSVGGQQLLNPQSIRFDGAPQYSTDEFLSVVGIKKGQVYTADYFNQSAQKLMATGVFDNVGFKFDGLELIYSIHENPNLYSVVIGNIPIETGAELDARLHQQIPLYHGRMPSEGTVFDDVRNALQSMVADEGIDAKVTFVPGGDNPGKKATAIKFFIDTPPVEIGDIQITGASDGLRAQIDEAAKRVNRKFDATNSAIVIEDQIASTYLGHGYPAAVIQARRSGKPVLENGVVRVPYTVTVQEGHAYKLGSVKLASGIPIAVDEVEKLTRSRDRYTQEFGYVTGMQSGVEGRLKGKGYLDCKVKANPEFDETAGVVNYTIDAVPGPQYHLGLLQFDNVSDSLRSLLMRNWQMMPGDPFNESYVANFILFAQKSDPVLERSLAGVKATYDAHSNPDTHEVNLVIRLQRQ